MTSSSENNRINQSKSLVISPHHEKNRNTRERLEKKLIIRAQKGDKSALQTLISQNLGYIKKIARHYKKLKLPISELVNEGVLGFSHAVHKFNLAQEVRLITYATFWIKHYILEFIAFNSNLITMPLKKSREIRKINQAILDLKSRLSRNPKMEELAEHLHMTPEEIRKLLPISLPLLSLEKYKSDEESTTMEGNIEDRSIRNPSDEAMDNVLKKKIREIILDFTEKERKVLQLYFGLNDTEPRSLREIGKEFSMSQEGVRKIVKRVIGRLRERSF